MTRLIDRRGLIVTVADVGWTVAPRSAAQLGPTAPQAGCGGGEAGQDT